jgi:hypothetical protein
MWESCLNFIHAAMDSMAEVIDSGFEVPHWRGRGEKWRSLPSPGFIFLGIVVKWVLHFLLLKETKLSINRESFCAFSSRNLGFNEDELSLFFAIMHVYQKTETYFKVKMKISACLIIDLDWYNQQDCHYCSYLDDYFLYRSNWTSGAFTFATLLWVCVLHCG